MSWLYIPKFQTASLLLNFLTAQRYSIQIKMDYQALAQQIPVAPRLWTQLHVQTWLHFVHLPALINLFKARQITGLSLLSLNTQILQSMGVSNNLIKRKLVRWIKQGFPQFDQHLAKNGFDNKENIPPLARKLTKENGCNKIKVLQKRHEECRDEDMVIRSCDGNLAAFYIMKESVLKIGRSPANTIRSLQISVQSQHAEIVKMNGKHFLYDIGTQTGTFIKIIHPRVLKVGTLLQMGSFLIDVLRIEKEQQTIVLEITHMQSQGKCQVVICLRGKCTAYSFGRRKSNNFYAEDEHLSGIHAKIFLQQGQFVIQDLHSTNGTWLRLSQLGRPSQAYLLQEGTIFKIGTTITYQCQGSKVSSTPMDIQYDDDCLTCQKSKKNILLLPCRHNAVCFNCAPNLEFCPVCKGAISQQIKIYI